MTVSAGGVHGSLHAAAGVESTLCEADFGGGGAEGGGSLADGDVEEAAGLQSRPEPRTAGWRGNQMVSGFCAAAAGRMCAQPETGVRSIPRAVVTLSVCVT